MGSPLLSGHIDRGGNLLPLVVSPIRVRGYDDDADQRGSLSCPQFLVPIVARQHRDRIEKDFGRWREFSIQILRKGQIVPGVGEKKIPRV